LFLGKIPRGLYKKAFSSLFAHIVMSSLLFKDLVYNNKAFWLKLQKTKSPENTSMVVPDVFTIDLVRVNMIISQGLD